jgi:hypothetical protein
MFWSKNARHFQSKRGLDPPPWGRRGQHLTRAGMVATPAQATRRGLQRRALTPAGGSQRQCSVPAAASKPPDVGLDVGLSLHHHGNHQAITGLRACGMVKFRWLDDINVILNKSFANAKPEVGVSPVDPIAAANVDEDLDYRIAQRMKSTERWRSFLAAHPDGLHAQSARAELDKRAPTGQRDQLWAGPEQGPPPTPLHCIHGKENCGGGYFEGRMQWIELLRVGCLAR